MNERLFKAILTYGARYRQEYLFEKYSCEYLLDDWREALMFFFGRACYQGRRDTLSAKVYEAAKDVLMPVLPLDAIFDNTHLEKWKIELDKRIGPCKGKAGKTRDVDMIISTLMYLNRLPQRNIIAYSVSSIRAHKTEDLYNELQRQKNALGIIQVGEKVASFYLRDLVTLFSLETLIPQSSLQCLQPIDTRVRQLAYKMKIVDIGANDSKIREAIIKLCIDRHASSLLFNQGAWYASMHSFSLLLDYLERYGLEHDLVSELDVNNQI